MFLDVKTAYGATGDGSTNDRPAFYSADTALTPGTLYVPRGTYSIQSDLTLGSDIRFEQGARLKPAASVTATLNGDVDAGVYQVFDLSAGGMVVLPRHLERVIPQWWGAKADATTNDTAAVQAALAALQAAGGGLLYFPPGTYKLATVSSPTAPTLTITADNVYLEGAGPASMLDFYPTGLAQACILFSGVNGGGVSNLKVVHNGSKAVNRKAISLTGANGLCIQLLNSRRCTVTGNHLRWGASGIDVRNSLDAASSTTWTTNLDHTVSHNFIADTAGYGLQCYHAAGCRILGNHVEGSSNEAYKFAGRNHAMTISGNHARWSGGDGMDFYDGLTESTITGNTVFDCKEFGYELKGTFGGSWSGMVDDYVFRDNTFSGNSAIQTGAAGISIASVRSVTLAGNNVISAGPKVELGTDPISISGSSWTKATGVTAAASPSRAPDDSFNADTVSGLGTTGRWVYQSGLFRGTPYTVTAWLKGSGTVQLVVYDDIGGAQTQLVTLTSTFTRYTFTATTAPTATVARAGIGSYDAGTATSVEVWGSTVSGPGSITAYNDLDDPSWTQVGSFVSPTGVTAPDGTATADTLDLTNPGSPAWVYYSRHLTANTYYVFSVWLKGSGTVSLVMEDDDPSRTASPPVPVPTLLVDLSAPTPNTWRRYTLSGGVPAGATYVRVGFGRYLGTETATAVTAWGMQVIPASHGIQVTNCQGVTLVGNNVAKCAGHGIFWQSSARGVMSGNTTVDNSWVDGVIQNCAFDGVNVDATSTVFSTGARSCNGLVTNHKGGQAYGLYLAGGTSSTVWGGDYTTNQLGSIVGVSGNYVAGVRNLSGAFLGAYLSSAPTSPVDGSPALVLAPRVSLKSATLPTGVTPSVAAANHFVTANTVATTITDFTNGVPSQPLVIEANDVFTTIANNANIATRSGANIPLAPGQMVRLQRNAAGNKWVEV